MIRYLHYDRVVQHHYHEETLKLIHKCDNRCCKKIAKHFMLVMKTNIFASFNHAFVLPHTDGIVLLDLETKL